MMDNFETMGDYLDKYNPFALKNNKNQILHFKSYDEIYLHTLKEIRQYCKRGYIDLALLVKHLTQFDDESCNEIADGFRKLVQKEPDQPMFIDWLNIGYEKDKLIGILKGLHNITETQYDWPCGEYAWVLFRDFNEKYTYAENIKEKSDT